MILTHSYLLALCSIELEAILQGSITLQTLLLGYIILVLVIIHLISIDMALVILVKFGFTTFLSIVLKLDNCWPHTLKEVRIVLAYMRFMMIP